MSRSHRRIIPSLLKSAEIHAFFVPAVGGIYLVFLSMRMISEKKNHRVDYLRTMGLLESANIISFAVVYIVFSIFPALVYEISGRLLRITFVSDAAVGVAVRPLPHR